MAKNHLKRTSYLYTARHSNDVLKNLGFEYKGELFKRSVSKEIFSNPLIVPLLLKIEELLFWCIEQTKSIKKQYAITYNKNNNKLN